MKEFDKDYMKGISSEYKAGYDHGRASMIKEVVIVIAIMTLLIIIFD